MRTSVWLGLVVLGCQAATPVASTPPPAESSEPTPPEPQEPEPPPEPEEPEPAEPSPPSPPPEPQGPTVAEVCEGLCKRVDGACDERSARKCRASCKKYVEKSAGCEAEYRAALECQGQAAASELCGNVAATECLDAFRDIKRCERGEKRPEPKQAKLPDGWGPITDDHWGVSFAMPTGAALDPKAARRTWRFVDGDVTYYVADVPPVTKVSSSALIRAVIDYVGYRCQKNLNLHGRFEVGDETVVWFDTGCLDGSQWHGVLRTSSSRGIVLASHGPPGAKVVTNEFYYSFKNTD